MQMDWSCLNCKYDDFYASAATMTMTEMRTKEEKGAKEQRSK